MSDYCVTSVESQPAVRQPDNYPATIKEAERLYLRHPALRFHRGRPTVPIGETLRRAIDREPDPLPESFFKRLAVLIAEQPERYGRLFRHAIEATREGQQRG